MLIKWYPFEVPVVMTNELPEDQFGEFQYYPSPRILISSGLEGSVLSSTILHEILEMVSEVHDLGIDENQIRTLEVALSQIFGQSPGLKDMVFPDTRHCWL